MRRLIIKPNGTWNDTTDPARFHTHLRLDNGTEPRLKLSGFSFFGEVGGVRHIPTGPHVVLYPEHNADDWDRVLNQGADDPRIRMTYAQWLAMLAAHKINLVRTWAFDLNESDSYPFFHQFASDQYDLNKASTRYQRRLVRFINIARKYGIIVHLTLSSDQMLRVAFWKFMPFHDKHAIVNAFPGDTGFDSFLNIGTGGTRYQILREMVRSLVNTVKPYWNVMFELMNEAGVQAPAGNLPSWHKTVARWLDEDLNDGTGKRTHLVTSSATNEDRPAIIDALVHNSENLVDIVSLHGSQWGGSDTAPQTDDQIRADTRTKVRDFYARHPNRPIALICDSDAFVNAQRDPQRYARIALQDLNLNYAHRWQFAFLSHMKLAQQLAGLRNATPAGLSSPDNTPQPAQTPVISTAESELAGTWFQHQFQPAAQDIGAMRRESVWIIGTNPALGGFEIHRWDGTRWTRIDGGGVRITVDAEGLPWVIDTNGAIRRRTSAGTWTTIAGPRGSDIGAGADGSVWLVGTAPLSGGHEIYRWTGSTWTSVGGAVAKRIAVDPIGRPWIVNDNGVISYRDGEVWTTIPGSAADIAVGLDDTVWIVSRSFGEVAYWLGTSFRGFGASAKAIAVDHDGLPWYVNFSNGIVFERRVSDAV